MEFTDDELTVLIEALRRFRLFVPDPARKLISEALVYRLGLALITHVEESGQGGRVSTDVHTTSGG